MKNNNKKMIILVACLLVVIGVSFAYFVSSVLVSGSGASIDATTATIQNSELKVEGSLEFNDLDIYPGHTNVSSIKVTATGDNELIPYNVIWSGTNTLNTPLNFTVYKTSSEIEVSATCEKTKGVVDGAMMYYEECSISNLESLGTSIASGTINKNETKVILAEDEFITSTASGTTMYYYVILEYPNLEEEQNSDIGGEFSGKVTVEKSDATPDINIVAAYIIQEDGTYKETSNIPQEGYTINTEKSVCSNGATPTGSTPNITINNLTKNGTSCYLYFDEYTAKKIILANITVKDGTPDFSKTAQASCSDVNTCETTNGLYVGEDDYGSTYYFRGAVDNNWVKFAGFYWRIIRINGDGTIRLIYAGTNKDSTSDDTIGESSFSKGSNYYNNNAYVGYMYTVGTLRGTSDESGIKIKLDDWYEKNLTSYANKVDGNSGFCGDRTPYSGTGTGTSATNYAGYNRLISNKTPTFKCSNKGDLYTINGNNEGNKALDYPIGLITADEVAYAGGAIGISNGSYYLYTGDYYWIMSPTLSDSYYANVFYVYSNGHLDYSFVSATRGVRPVINLKADVTINGSGTTDDPYEVVS